METRETKEEKMRYEIYTCDICWRTFGDNSSTKGGVSLDDGANLTNWFYVCARCVEEVKGFIGEKLLKNKREIRYAIPKNIKTQYAKVELKNLGKTGNNEDRT